MVAHHGDDDRVGQSEKVFVESSGHHERLLDERDALSREKRVGLEGSAELGSAGAELLHHAILAPGYVHDHVCDREGLFVAVGAIDLELVWGQKSMSTCGSARNLASSPAHGLRKRDSIAQLGKDFGQYLRGRFAGLVDLDSDVVPFVGGSFAERAHVHRIG